MEDEDDEGLQNALTLSLHETEIVDFFGYRSRTTDLVGTLVNLAAVLSAWVSW